MAANVKPRIAALVLAAGLGTRMRGLDKMLVHLHGKPLIAHALDNLPIGELAQIVVVTGDNGAAVREALPDNRIQLSTNPDPADGMGTSLACGVRALEQDIDGVLICLGDMPMIRALTVSALIRAFMASNAICLPCYQGQRGHPVLLPAAYFPDLAKLSGDQGARALIAAAARVQEVETDDPGILIDVDTPETLAELNERRDTAGAATTLFSTACD